MSKTTTYLRRTAASGRQRVAAMLAVAGTALSLMPAPALIPVDGPLPVTEGPAQVSGVAWIDADGDGFRGETESALGGVVVRLVSQGGTSRESLSANDGTFEFLSVATDTYTVQADLPDGYSVAVVPDGTGGDAVANDFHAADTEATVETESFVASAADGKSFGLGLVEDEAESTSTTVAEETTTTTISPESTSTTVPQEKTSTTVPQETTSTTISQETTATSTGNRSRLAGGGGISIQSFAEDGVGLYPGAIDWFEWGSTAGEQIPPAGVTRTNTRTVAGGELETTCVLGPPAGGTLSVYRPGTFSGDALDEMYNVGGTGANNQMLIGLSNFEGGATIGFDFDCSVTFEGDPVPIAGLVMADAEQSGTNEYVQADIAAGATWRIIDRYRSSGCSSSTSATLTAGNTLTLTGPSTLCSTGPAVVAFMDGASSAVVEIQGGGRSAIALGVMLFTDFGDAPSSYGEAGSLYSPGFTGGTLGVGTTAVSGGGFALGVPEEPAPRLGATTDSDQGQQSSADASADGDDEDAISPPAPLTTFPGMDYTLSDVACTGPGLVAGWIDWDASGTFDPDERSDEVDCATGSVDLTWIVPGDAPEGSTDTFLRLRIGADSDDVAEPTGIAIAGEVEDYALEVNVPSPWACTPDGNLFQGAPVSIIPIDLVTGDEGTSLDNIYPYNINAVGYNVLDGYIYGHVQRASEPQVQQIVKVGADGSVLELGLPPGVPVTGRHVGDVDDNGHYWMSDGVTWWQIDVDPDSPGYFTLLDSGPVQGGGIAAYGFADWAYVPNGQNSLYAVAVNAGLQRLFRFDRTTKLFSPVGPELASVGAMGAVYADAEGFLYGSVNGNGSIYRIDALTGSREFFASGPDSASNDGAMCHQARIPLDFGDAPASYGTSLADDGPRHAIPGYDAGTSTAPLMLGTNTIDAEVDGQPTPDADGDDINGANDDTGVTFNPDLGYPSPTLRTGLDPVTLQPVENTLEVQASDDGFVSVWVDWNQDGDFDDTGEQVATQESVVAGTNDITFAQGDNPGEISTFVRVRYSTDPDSIATPYGPAPDGEVEDYRVLVERLVQSDTCATSALDYYAFTFNSITDFVGTGEPGSSARYPDAAVVNGIPVDMVVETIAGETRPDTAPPNGYYVGDGLVIQEDDAGWQITADATIRYSFYAAGTTNPVAVNGVFTVNDMDGPPVNTQEIGTFDAADLAAYAITEGSLVEIVETAGEVSFFGNDAHDGDPQSRFQVVLEDVETFDVRWQGSGVGGGSGFGFDGDADLGIQPPACSDFADAPESYGTLLADDGARHTIVPGLTLGVEIDFDPDGQPTADADGDNTRRLDDEDGVATPIEVTAGQETTVDVTATNTTGEDAVLAGWIDLDGSGTFDASELVTAVVPDGSIDAVFQLTFPLATSAGDTYARFRLFPDGVTVSPTGPASAGEVEDYAVTFVPGLPIFLGCSNLVTFDTGNENWRAATTSGGFTVVMPPQPVGWEPSAGNPDGAVIEDDLDGNWTELWTPDLLANGYSTDYSFAIGETLQFDYRNNTGIAYDVYVAVQGAGGQRYFYNFRDQIINSTQWNRIVVPMVASEWQTGFSNSSGPIGGSPTDAEFEAALTSVDHFAFSIEGRVGADRTAFDNFGQPCDDFGDAPDSYLTLSDSNGPSHRALGYDSGGATAPLMLGGSIDIEDDGSPTTAADGDESVATADEDGVADLITVAAGTSSTVTVSVTNDTGAAATLAGWIDLDDNGAFDSAELVVAPVPANTTDDFDLVFPAATTANDTYARFRLYPGSIDPVDILPYGPANGGEVEDYPVVAARVHFEKTVTPDDVAVLQPGDTFTYSVTVSNLGAVPLTDPSFTDDLTGVVGDGDAIYNGDAAVVSGPGAVSFTPDVISWDLDGDTLDPGEQAVVEYSVTIADPPAGDAILANGVLGTGPGSNCVDDPPTDPDCYVEIPQPDIEGAKASDAVGNVEPGQTITYQFTINNVGPGEALNAVVWDDLSQVLDDADYNGDVQILAGGPGTVSFNAANERIVWNGPLDAAGGAVDSVTIQYTVTVHDAESLGDGSVRNALLMTGCPFPAIYDTTDPNFDPDCVVVDEVEAWTAHKSSDAQGLIEAGDVVTYTLTVENTGNVDLPAADVVVTDDLSGVLDDAVYNGDADQGAVFSDPVITWSDDLAVDEVVTITYSVTVNEPDALGDGQLVNAITGPLNCPDPAVTDPQDPDFDPDCVTINDVIAYTVSKSSDAADPALPGDVVTYTLTVENTGNIALTPADVLVTDDLTEVLDDATYNGDADQGANYSEPILSWSGALAVDGIVTITYSVTVNDADSLGDGLLANAVTGGDCPDPAVTDPQDPDFDPDCVVIDDIAAWAVAKTSDANDPALPGDVVTYTLTVENTGNIALTPADVLVTDDLTEVLDDATYNGDADQGANYSEPVISWSDDLAVDEVVTITYSVTVNDADSLGDGLLANAVTGGDCPDPAVTDPEDPDFDPDCVVIDDIAAWTVSKTSDANDPALPGDVIAYTLTVENTGNVALSDLEVWDDVSDVRDDAQLESDSTWDVTAGAAGYNGPLESVHWANIDLNVDQVATLTYEVTVHIAANLGDGVLLNAVTGGDCPDPAVTDPTDPDFDPDCVVINEVPAYTVVKTSDAADPMPGDIVTYTVAVTNTGGVDLVGPDAATFSDDLTGVLDDATYNGDAGADIGTASFADPTLSWVGNLAVGDVATVTYSVTVDQPVEGDHALVNAVVGGDCPTPPVADPTSNAFDPDCVTITPLPGVEITKVIFGAPVTDLSPGDSFEYVVTVENVGQLDLTDETFTDDLSQVLDDATLDGASVSADIGTASFADPTLSWIGDLAIGEIATIRYTIVIDDPLTGDGELMNGVVGSIYSNCFPPDPADPDCWEETPVPNVWVAKDLVGPADPQPGDVVSYRITIENRGGADAIGEVVTDDLTGVLDDAVYNGDAAAASGSVAYAAPTLTWTGDIPAGATVELTYSVTVNPAGELGDGLLDNAVSGGENCPDDGACTTNTPVPDYEAEKAVVSPTGEAEPGDVVTYQITVTNTGGAPLAEAVVADDLVHVLDDAVYNGDAVATIGAVSYAEPVLTWTGPLAVGEQATITYSVTVDDGSALGDGELINVLTSPNCPVLAPQDHHEGMPPGCVTDTPVAAVGYRKTIVRPASGDVRPGDTVKYRVEVFNQGGTDLEGISFTDDLSDVLANATYLGDHAATTGSVTYAEPRLTWTGDLAIGGSATVEYSVRVDRDVTGDATLDNRVVGLGPATNCPAASQNVACVTQIGIAVGNPLPHTGADIARLALVAAALLLLGWAIVAAARARQLAFLWRRIRSF